MTLQIDKQDWRRSMEGSRVTVYQHSDDTITIGFGPQQIGIYTALGQPLKPPAKIRGPLSGKGLAPFLKSQQTGHLTC